VPIPALSFQNRVSGFKTRRTIVPCSFARATHARHVWFSMLQTVAPMVQKFRNVRLAFGTRRIVVAVLALPAVAAIAVAAAAAIAPGHIVAAQAQGARYDTLIVNGRVFDGSGRPPVQADIAIKDGRIAAIGHLAATGAGTGAAAASTIATRTIDAGGCYVTPGFIDVHSHAAEGLVREGLQQGQPLLAQGVTTIIGNPDGGGPTDLKQQKLALERRGLGPNVALLIGHGSVRGAVLGMADQTPNADQLARMKALVRQAMEDGAFGLSSGLFYAPGSYAKTEEVIELTKVTAPYGGLYTSHIRDESNYTIGVVASVDEVIRIADEAHVTGIVSHMKALGPDNWGLGATLVQHIEQARARGVSVFADQYPYEASSTSLTAAVLPRWAQVDGDAAMKARLQDAATRAKMLPEARENIRRRGGAASLAIAHYAPDRSLEGTNLEDVSKARGLPPEEAAIELILKGDVSIVSFNMSEQDIERIMRQPWTMASSDGGLVPMNAGVPHPRNYGAFARRIARYVNERHTVPLDAALRAMTGLSADVFGIPDRGYLREGAWADVLVFDPAAVRDVATYTKPHQLAQGMWYVLVNGTQVVEHGELTTALPGRVLLKPIAVGAPRPSASGPAAPADSARPTDPARPSPSHPASPVKPATAPVKP
jgi:N-acyl-D-amino-acid deacylase